MKCGFFAIGVALAVFGGLWLNTRRVQMKRSGVEGECVMHLKQIALALLSYEDKYGALPPAYVSDADGKPMHSWRVLILPFLGGEDVYAKYDFDEPWNGPNNSRLQADLPAFVGERFHCPTGRSQSGMTNYFAVVGPRTLWPGMAPGLIQEQMVEARPEVLVIELPDSEVNWMEPKDFTVEAVISALESLSGAKGDIHPHGIQYVDTAQRIHRFSKDHDALLLRKLLTTAN